MIKSFKYLKPYWYLVLLIFALIAVRSWLNLQLPNYMGNIVAEVKPEGSFNEQVIWQNGLNMIFNTVAGVILVLISGFVESKVSAAYGKKLRSEVYSKIEKFSMNEIELFQTSSLITRTTNDVQQVQQTVNMLLRMVVMLPFMSIGAVIMAYQISPQLSTILIFAALAMFAVIITLLVVGVPRFKIIQKKIDKLNLVTRENLSGLRVVRAYNTQEMQAGKIEETAKETMKQSIFVNRILSAMFPTMAIITALTSAGIALFAVNWNLIPGAINAEDISTLIQYATQTIMSFMMITMVLVMVPRASISAKRLMEVIESDIMIHDPDHPAQFDENKVKGKITFENVSFKYPHADEAVLSHISFTAEAGKMTAFIGSTGSGKSTLVNLIPRFFDPTEGRVLLDDVDIKAYAQQDYLKSIGYVPQKGHLFKGTIESNIAFGQDELNTKEIVKAARIAQAEDFIESFDEKYQSPINQGGSNVSGGQRQRLSIARAIAKEPKVYIFDDSFSALDYKTDQTLRSALKKAVDATMIVVAQRINTIKYADSIVVLDQGHIVGIGTHDELMKTCSVYQEIAYSQLSKEELGNE